METSHKGLYLPFGQSIEVDPVNPGVLFVVVDNTYNWLAEDFECLYRSRMAVATGITSLKYPPTTPAPTAFSVTTSLKLHR